jgi:ribosome maturation factor RimP
MAVQHTHPELEQLIDEQIAGYPEVFLVSVKMKPTNNIRVYLDADNGLSIEKCVKINRALYKQIEEKAWYPEGDFSLEVSSPGIDEPLLLTRQFLKNVGRSVEVMGLDDTKQEGELLAVTDELITIRVSSGKGKKQVQQDVEIPRSQIKQTKVLIRF